MSHREAVATIHSEAVMIRVVMFDLGMTLVGDDRRPFPHVENALAAVSGFKTADGKPLRSCLVSDFTMATAPVTAAKVAALFKEYLAILDETGLRPFFEPVKKRVTLSTHAGVQKPDRRIFEKALERLGADVALDSVPVCHGERDPYRRRRAGTLGMATLQFGSRLCRLGRCACPDRQPGGAAPAGQCPGGDQGVSGVARH